MCMGVGGCLLEEFVEICVEGWVFAYDGLDDVALWVDDDLGWETFDGVLGWDIRGAWTIDVLPREFVLLYGCLPLVFCVVAINTEDFEFV